MNTKLLLEDFCIEAKYMRGVSDKTIARYSQNISFFMRTQNLESIEDITMNKVYDFFLNGRISRNWSTQTYHTYYQTLRVFFRWCINRSFMTENYAERLELPKKEKTLPKSLSKSDAHRLLEIIYNYPYTQEYVRHRNYALFATFLHAGLRKNEALHLHVRDVDIENRSIFVRQGKGNKDRIVPMSMTLAFILEKYSKERSKARKTCPEFFTCSNRNRGFTQNGLKYVTNQLKVASRIPLTIHKLRHTFATLMLEGGCDIFSLSKMMGHSDIKTTTIYLSASAEHLREQVTKHPMNSIFTK